MATVKLYNVLFTLLTLSMQYCQKKQHYNVVAFETTHYHYAGLNHNNALFNAKRITGNKSVLSSAAATSTTRLQMVSINTKELNEQLPSKEVIQVIDEVSSKSPDRKVIASDVARYAGISINQARKDLTSLASLTRGDIAVTSDGELMYTFSNNIQGVLSRSNLKFKIQKTWNEAVWPKLFYAIRVSFGIMLLVSLVVVFSTLAFISAGGGSDRDDDRRGGSSRGGGSMFSFGMNPFGPSPLDFFYYRPYYNNYPTNPSEEKEMGFLESTFSYIFGDGNPNANIEQLSISKIATFITQNNGAVTAEQLAPFITDSQDKDNVPSPPTDSKESTYVDESFVLPIVTKLNGVPEVTPDGDIIYIFPDLQVSATNSDLELQQNSNNEAARKNEAVLLQSLGLDSNITTKQLKRVMLEGLGINTIGALERSDLIQALGQYVNGNSAGSNLPQVQRESNNINKANEYLQEEEYKFSLAEPFQKVVAGGLGVVNLFGALTLGNYLSQFALYGIQLPSYYGIVQSGYPLLLIYAVLFNIIPLGRYFWIQNTNSKIQMRNKKRRLWNTYLQTAPQTLARKLKSALAMGKTMKRLGASGSDDIVFDTSKEFEKEQVKRDEQSLNDFDKFLE